jgi:hypothetical protein
VEPERVRELVGVGVVEPLVRVEPEPGIELVAVVGAGVTCETVGSLGAGVPVGALDVVFGRGVGRLRAVVRDVPCSVTAGARLRPPEIGSEERPMCWLVSWLVAHVMPAVSTSPSSAASAHIAVCRLIRAP